MAAASCCIGQGKMAFEIHLPQAVRFLVFEASLGRLGLVNMRYQLAPMPSQNGSNGVRMRLAHSFGQQCFELTSTPTRIFVVQGQYCRFQLGTASLGR